MPSRGTVEVTVWSYGVSCGEDICLSRLSKIIEHGRRYHQPRKFSKKSRYGIGYEVDEVLHC